MFVTEHPNALAASVSDWNTSPVVKFFTATAAGFFDHDGLLWFPFMALLIFFLDSGECVDPIFMRAPRLLRP
jgi:hypothetical protein